MAHQAGRSYGVRSRADLVAVVPFQLTAGAIRPASTSIDCSLPGDHCRSFGDYEID